MVRGVSAGLAPIFNGASTTAYYLDAAPFGLPREAIGPDLNAYDVQRVEVLRGPQGTLYGVVRVLTNEGNPHAFEFKTRASTSYTETGGMNYRGDLAVNAPIVDDKLAARMMVGYQNLVWPVLSSGDAVVPRVIAKVRWRRVR